MKKVAIQGYKASYHDQAARQFFGSDIEIVPCDTFKQVFDLVKNNDVDTGVAAVENSLYGSINEVYDLLLKYRLWVGGEAYLRIEHCLIGTPDAQLSSITKVHSQVMALGQCKDWLETHMPQAQLIEEHDTTASVVLVKKEDDQSMAAIASEEAAKLHNMQILARNIEDNPQNYTRFFVLSRQRQAVPQTNKTSLILKTPADTKPGALFRALEVFAKHNINLTMLHSRPLVGKAWHYMFYVDVGIGLDDPTMQTAIKELEKQRCEIIILGSYRAAL